MVMPGRTTASGKRTNLPLKRINALIKDTRRNPFEGIGKPEPLKHDLAGLWSRRINGTDRLTYKVLDDIIVILACKGHYE